MVLGQQVSIKAARTHIGRLVAAYGQPVTDSAGDLTYVSSPSRISPRSIRPIWPSPRLGSVPWLR